MPYTFALSLFLLIPCLLALGGWAAWQYARSHAAELARALADERARTSRLTEELRDARASFAFCVQEVTTLAAVETETNPGLRRLARRADLIGRLYETHTSGGIGPLRILDLSRILGQAALDVRPLETSLILPPMQVPVLGVNRDLTQSLAWMLAHIARGPGELVQVKLAMTREHAVLALWSELARAHVTQPSRAPHTSSRPTLESHLAIRLLRACGCEVRPGSGPDYTITFPLAHTRHDAVSGNIPIEPLSALARAH